MARRGLLMLVALVVAVLLGEGLLSLLTGRSLRDLARPAPLVFREQQDEERFAAAARLPGPYRVHPDPLVGYVLKSGVEFELAGATVQADHLGIRRRPAGAVPEDALRLVVLGDSVAFGQGLPEDQVLAQRLEVMLNEARGRDVPEVACRTVAVPGWNVRNAVHFLLDHWDELDPDLVLWMPVENDLEDTDGAYETGHRRNLGDPATPDAWIPVHGNYAYLMSRGAELLASGHALTEALAGPPVLAAGLTPASRWRCEDLVVRARLLQERLRQQGASLLVLPHTSHPVAWQAALALEDAEDGLAVVPLLETFTAADGQADDPHPNAEAVEAMALWTAATLLERGLLEAGAGAPLPAVPAAYQHRRRPRPDRATLEQMLRDARETVRVALRPTVSHETGEGLRQILGGINRDGSLAHGLRAVLGGSGDELRVRLAPLAGRPDLGPVRVEVRVDGVSLGAVSVTPGEEATDRSFALDAPAGPVEVSLHADRWCVTTIHGASRVSSCQFLSVSRVDGDGS